MIDNNTTNQKNIETHPKPKQQKQFLKSERTILPNKLKQTNPKRIQQIPVKKSNKTKNVSSNQTTHIGRHSQTIKEWEKWSFNTNQPKYKQAPRIEWQPHKSNNNFNEVYTNIKEFFTYPWCNGYHRRKWTRRHEFKFWTRLVAFHIELIPLGKVWIQLFSLQLWVNSRADWFLQPWWGN